jgi:predicted anti-sigma-YlaC factor YlaD
MHEDMRTILNAYMDGELHGTRLLEMETHLASCESCQNELKELHQVSDLLQAAPVPAFMPVERFVSNLTLRLPRHTLRELPPRTGFLAWWLVPVGLLGAWVFVQTVFTLANMLAAANITGMLGQAVTWLGGGQQMAWFVAVTGLFGGQAGGFQPALSLLNGLNVFSANLLKGFLWQALIVLLYWGWLLAWWLRRRPQPLKMENAS